MGWHNCEYCIAQGKKPETSSGDVTLNFSDGKSYQVPDMLPHYVEAHGFAPPPQFVNNVLNTELTGGKRIQTRSLSEPVGYLTGDYDKGPVPPHFLEKLKRVMELAAECGGRVQTKGTDALR